MALELCGKHTGQRLPKHIVQSAGFSSIQRVICCSPEERAPLRYRQTVPNRRCQPLLDCQPEQSHEYIKLDFEMHFWEVLDLQNPDISANRFYYSEFPFHFQPFTNHI